MIITSSQYFKLPPQKIVSLVPSQTELLSYFDLDQEVTGITKFCVHPKQWYKTKQRVGGTKNLNIPLIKNAISNIGESPRPEYIFDDNFRILTRSLVLYRFIKSVT